MKYNNKGSFALVSSLVIVLVCLLIGGFLWYQYYGISREVVDVGNDGMNTLISEGVSEECRELLNNIKRTDSGELVQLYEELVEQYVIPEIVAAGCDYGPESVHKKCLQREEVHRKELICMQKFIAESGITKQELRNVESF